MNTFGKIFTLTTFGESHGPAIGGVIDGVPAGISLDLDAVQKQLDRRRPGQSNIVTQRNEADKVEFLSGLFEGKTTGTPIGFMVRNADHHSSDYDNMREVFRPSHADYTYFRKYGIRDHRGGGRSSARETLARVVGGAVAQQILESLGVKIYAYTSQVGDISLPADFNTILDEPSVIDSNVVRCPDGPTAILMEEYITAIKKDGDTTGGVITGVIEGMPVGIGEPVFDKFQALLAHAMLSINAAKGFEYGMGFAGASHRGSEMADKFCRHDDGTLGTLSNHSGGIQGGITNGQPIVFRVAFKPVATLLRETETFDTKGNPVTIKARGRHDPCVLPRAVPIVEAMAAMCALDSILIDNARRVVL